MPFLTDKNNPVGRGLGDPHGLLRFNLTCMFLLLRPEGYCVQGAIESVASVRLL